MRLKENRPQIKIAAIGHSSEIGGAESSLLTFLRHMDGERFRTVVILNTEGPFSKKLREENIPVQVIPLPSRLIGLKRGEGIRSFFPLILYFFYFQAYLTRLCFYLKKDRFDLILTNTVKAHLYGSIAASLCRMPLIWRFHDILSPPDFNPLLVKAITFLGNLFPAKVLAVSHTSRNYLVKSGFKSNKVEVVFNGIDPSRLESKNHFKDIQTEAEFSNGVRRVGCVGRIIPQKGQRSFLLAIPKVVHHYPETSFLVVGDPPPGEKKYKEELLEIVRDKGIESWVKFTGFRMDIGNVIRALDIVVFPSVAPESFGLSILEAMHLGKPVIASNFEAVHELIEDGVTGVLVDPARPEQIADRIIDLFSDHELYGKIATEAKGATKKFSLENYIGAMEKACRDAASREVSP